MAIRVMVPGLLTTVQDAGRTGHAAEGYPECGACDRFSYRKALILSGNTADEAALECTLLGPTLQFTAPAIVAVSGNVHPLLNGMPVPADFPIWAEKDSVLCIGPVGDMRAYVSFCGGLDVPPVLGSRSTDRKSRIGGYQGRALKQDDVIPLKAEPSRKDFERLRGNARRVVCPPFAERCGLNIAHMIPGPQQDAFTQAGLDTFFGSEYTVDPKSDRMGLRLNGPAVESVHGTDILSDGILEGSIQITAGGQPIIMLADHQTTGGYAKIATVVPEDVALLAQLRPGDKIRFEKIDLQTAAARYRADCAALRQLMKGMGEHHEQSGSEFGSGRKLRRVPDRHGRRDHQIRHIRQRGLRLPRR